MLGCTLCGGRGRVPEVSKDGNGVQDMPCQKCNPPGVVHAWDDLIGPEGGTRCGLHYRGSAFEFTNDWGAVSCPKCKEAPFAKNAQARMPHVDHEGGGIEQDPVPHDKRAAIASLADAWRKGRIFAPGAHPIVRVAFDTVDRLNALVAMPGVRELLIPVFTERVFQQVMALDEHGCITLATHCLDPRTGLERGPEFSWTPRDAIAGQPIVQAFADPMPTAEPPAPESLTAYATTAVRLYAGREQNKGKPSAAAPAPPDASPGWELKTTVAMKAPDGAHWLLHTWGRKF